MKKNGQKWVVLGLVTMAMVMATQAEAGFVVQKEMHEADPMTGRDRVELQTEYFDTEAGKFAYEGEILRFDTGELIVVNNDKKTYYRDTIDGYCRDVEAMVQEMMDLPEYQQAQEMMKQMQAQYGKQGTSASLPKPILQRVGSDKVAGYSADHYQIRVGDEVQEEVWLATDTRLNPLNPDKNRQLGKKAKEFQRQIKACMQKFSKMTPGVEEGVEPLAERNEFELRRRDPVVETKTVDILERSIPASRFEPPKGYRKVNMKEVSQAQMDRDEHDASGYNERYNEGFPAALEEKEERGQESEYSGEQIERESHEQTKNGIDDELSDKVRQGVKGLMGLFSK